MQFPRALACAVTTAALVVSTASLSTAATVTARAAEAATAAPGPEEPVVVIALTDDAGERTPAAADGLAQLAEDDAPAVGAVAGRSTTTASSAVQVSAAATSTIGTSDIAVLTAPMATEEFLVAGLTWDAGERLPAGTRIFVRVLEDGGWSDWLETEAEEAVDATDAGGLAGTDPFVTGGAEAIQVQVSGDAAALPAGLALHLIPGNPVAPRETLTRTPGVPAELPTDEPTAPTEPADVATVLEAFTPDMTVQTVAAATSSLAATAVGAAGVTVPAPSITSRSGWGADESFMSWRPRYAPLKAAIVHHTAGTNDYAPEQSASIVRGIYFFHAETRDWGDIGYNFLVDKWGRIFEGRSGSLAAPAGQMTIGAHAGGFNTGTLGISAMGDYTKVAPPRAIFNSMANVIAWQFARAGIDLGSASGIISPGTAARPKGQNLPRIFGHRDVGATSCPGAIASWLPELIRAVDNQALQLYYLNNSFGPVADIQFRYGAKGSDTFVGDWDGDGVDTLATREGNRFFVTNENSYGAADLVFGYGKADDTILVGDWDGDGKDTFAVRRGKEYHVRNTLSSGPAQVVIAYGFATDQVLVGDWDGNGQDTFAVRRGHIYHVKNSMAGGPADTVVGYGRAADEVLVGDWDGDGRDTLAVKREARYFIKNTIAAGSADLEIVYGRPDDLILVGDWDGDGSDTLGVMRP